MYHDRLFSLREKAPTNNRICGKLVTYSSETVNRRVCFAAHGGRNCDGDTEQILEWFRSVHERLKWEEAKTNCEEIGGKLFDNLNGSLSQLELLSQKADHQDFYVGVWSSDGVIWRRGNGEVIPAEKLLWDKLESPSGDGYQGRVFEIVCDSFKSVRLIEKIPVIFRHNLISRCSRCLSSF